MELDPFFLPFEGGSSKVRAADDQRRVPGGRHAMGPREPRRPGDPELGPKTPQVNLISVRSKLYTFDPMTGPEWSRMVHNGKEGFTSEFRLTVQTLTMTADPFVVTEGSPKVA